MGRFGMGELLVILALVVLLFGAKRLPELASGIGKAIKNFRRSVEGEDDIDVTPEEKKLPEKSRVDSLEKDTETEDAEILDKKS
ncbi:MAG: twin-arginine translocase TatA/TatE family subunit [Deltaproteobacteria bacterium]|nr:twin-arginine translocase TatA/TatE family subunit [Deltaproteobacteria bacterium]